MRQSFIAPRAKKVLSVELTWLLSIFLFLIVVMAGSAFFLDRAITSQRQTLSETKTSIETLKHREQEAHVEIERLQRLEKMREAVSTANRLKKENVKNFFDLVPEGVVLQLAELRDGILRLKGTTESPKHFRATFQRSLDSLFSRSSTKFKRLKNSSYSFNSISFTEVQK